MAIFPGGYDPVTDIADDDTVMIADSSDSSKLTYATWAEIRNKMLANAIGVDVPADAIAINVAGNTTFSYFVGIGCVPSAAIDICGDSYSTTAIEQNRYSDDSSPLYHVFQKARGTSETPVIINIYDQITRFQFQAYDGSIFSAGASIAAFCTGTPSSGIIPTELRFYTSDVSGNLNQNLTITNEGDIKCESTIGAFTANRMTTTQRDALTAINGMIIYNTTTSAFNFYENGSWVTK